MKTEREKFEDWFKEKYSYSAEYFEITKFDESMGFYTANVLYSPDSSIAAWVLRASFESWQAAKAQAAPEGFVLVSKDPAKDTIIEMASVCLLPRCKNGDVEYLNLDEAKEVYQAAIKAQEPAND